jgi:hypothetical protein
MIYRISSNAIWVAIFGLFVSCSQGSAPEEKVTIAPASSYFPEERPQVLVLGTFHFDYPGLDSFKASEEDKIDVLKEPKKSEVTALINYLKAFKPTKIALEARPGWGAVRKLREYKQGQHRDNRDERYQIGMRMAEELGLDTLYSIDAEPFIADLLEVTDTTFLKALGEDYDFRSDSYYDSLMTQWYMADTKMVTKVPLIDYLKHMNNRESHEYGYGAYLIGDFKLGDYRGADVLSTMWYNRNLRIFRNLQRITEGPQDRILVVIGNGHAAILRQLLEMSPEFDFVELDSL